MDELALHLAEHYAIAVESLDPLDHDVFHVHGPGWVARRFPPHAEDATQATADLLHRLAPTRFPAEQPAHEEPVSVCDGRPVLVTGFVEGTQAPGTPRMFAALGAYLGALHERPGDALPPGGGWHHLVPQGTPRDEIAAAVALLGAADVDPAARTTLLAELLDLDDCADLPHALVHPDFVPANAILRPQRGVVIVDWAGAGRGPRLWSLGFLLWTAGARDLSLVAAVMSRYLERVELTAQEWDRLPGAIRARPLTLDCWSTAHGRLSGAAAVQRLDPREEMAEAIAHRARSATLA